MKTRVTITCRRFTTNETKKWAKANSPNFENHKFDKLVNNFDIITQSKSPKMVSMKTNLVWPKIKLLNIRSDFLGSIAIF